MNEQIVGHTIRVYLLEIPYSSGLFVFTLRHCTSCSVRSSLYRQSASHVHLTSLSSRNGKSGAGQFRGKSQVIIHLLAGNRLPQHIPVLKGFRNINPGNPTPSTKKRNSNLAGSGEEKNARPWQVFRIHGFQ